jgi:ferritin-like metal-binding protein YciE
MSTFIA